MYYDLPIDKVCVGASSLLMYFDPFKVPLTISNDDMLVDGAIIAENPSMYSTFYAQEFNKIKHVRVLSLGSGYKNSYFQ